MTTDADDRLIAAMSTQRFWRTYAYDDADGFDVDTEGERIAGDIGDDVRVDLPAHGAWRLRLSLCFDVTLHVLYLATMDSADDEWDGEDPDGDDDSDEQYELGHWDQARWHPWCLRWEELEAVQRAMRADPAAQTVPPQLATLLLARFVGHGVDDAPHLAARRELIAAQFTRLGLFHGAEADRLAAAMLTTPPEDDYAWRRSAEHGWTFGGSYGCYSNRNADHDFPFGEFARFRTLLGVHDPADRADPF